MKCKSCGDRFDPGPGHKELEKDERCATCYAEIHEGFIPEQTPSKESKGAGGGVRIIRKVGGL